MKRKVIKVYKMIKNTLFQFSPRLIGISLRAFSSLPGEVTAGNPTKETNTSLSGFAKAFEKQTNIANVDKPEENSTFAALMRNSKFVDLGDPTGKIVVGKIFHVVEDDLYIDFGWKFHCVCTRPSNRGHQYVRGTRVRIQIKDLELSSRFLGSSTDLTLLEADCKLLGIVSTPINPASETTQQL